MARQAGASSKRRHNTSPRSRRNGSPLVAANAIKASCVPPGRIAGQTSVGRVPGGTNARAGREAASRSRSYDGGVPSGTPTGSISGFGEPDGDDDVIGDDATVGLSPPHAVASTTSVVAQIARRITAA